jgi:hypothetical protein
MISVMAHSLSYLTSSERGYLFGPTVGRARGKGCIGGVSFAHASGSSSGDPIFLPFLFTFPVDKRFEATVGKKGTAPVIDYRPGEKSGKKVQKEAGRGFVVDLEGV